MNVLLHVEQDGSENTPAHDIKDKEWEKMEQTLQDLEKVTKQGEQLIERQDKPEQRNKELKELVTKLSGVILENKEVEVSLDVQGEKHYRMTLLQHAIEDPSCVVV